MFGKQSCFCNILYCPERSGVPGQLFVGGGGQPAARAADADAVAHQLRAGRPHRPRHRLAGGHPRETGDAPNAHQFNLSMRLPLSDTPALN